MLTSQTSSSSPSSLFSSITGEKARGFGYPEKFKQNCIFSRKVFFDPENYVTVLITSLFELIECKPDEVVNYINLKSLCDNVKGSVSVEDVDFEVMIKDSGTVYALKLGSTLFGIERSSSQLKVLKTVKNVHSFKCLLDEGTLEMVAKVTFKDATKLVTSFQDDDLEEFIREKESPTFAEVYESARQISKTAASHLEKLTKEIEEMSLQLYGQTKTMPKIMLEEVSEGKTSEGRFVSLITSQDPNERSPLVRYGSVWTRVLNDKVVIGIPIFCNSKR